MSEHGPGGTRTAPRPAPSGERPGRPARTPERPAPSRAVYRRRRLVVLTLALLLVAGIVALVVALLPGGSDAAADPAPSATSAAVLPTTPTLEPVERPKDATRFELSLPDKVGRFALVAEDDSPAFDVDEPNEAWALTYADGAGPEATRVTLDAGQWIDEGQAAGAFDTAADALREATGPSVEKGDVSVAQPEGDPLVTGTYERYTDGPTTIVLWRNGTAVLRASGPSAEMESFYARFPF
ncbi:hypothetical protein CLV28_0603 [Sediminihabitans luteus]|uniref:Uncharacterized protein n=1 Tax=Sediminihabitans luteus TaxID=1138585 RepID=A0A2M9CZL1_9CELL|nr:hypothetical protein [Sediminihabitans luteus]PJJ77384.1 hypothetical protein CLV28_0603 [Sediminihabitans luteus]GII98277.1 hypothetical protein Slu03_06550 [Sediminihabitans luteus]